MSDDVSQSVRVSVVIILAASLIMVTMNVTLPAINYIANSGQPYYALADMEYKQLINSNGKRINAVRLYRSIEEAYSQIGSLSIIEHPVTDSTTINYMMYSTDEFVDPKLQAWTNLHADEPNTIKVRQFDDYTIGVLLEHDYVNQEFKVRINKLSDDRLEIILESVDEYDEYRDVI